MDRVTPSGDGQEPLGRARARRTAAPGAPHPAAPHAPAPHPVDPRLVDTVLAVGIALVVALVVAADLEGTGRAGPAAYLFAAGFGLVLVGRRRFPRAVLVLTVLGIFGYYIADLPPIGIALPAVAALYSAAELGRTRWAVGAGAVLVVVAAYFRVSEGLPTAYLYSYELVTNAALIAAAVALGTGVRLGRESRAHEERVRRLEAAEQAHAADRRLEAERLRIARDLHDAVGHSMAVISVHAGVAEEAVGDDDAAASRALGHVREAASQSLRQLRSTVRLLRSPVSEDHGIVGLDALPGVVAAAGDAGLAVVVHSQVPPGRLDGAIDAAAYRIVQEAVTNVLRHSRAARAEVGVELVDGRLSLEVLDDGGQGGGRDGGPAQRPPAAGGQGLLGMRERVALLGGRCDAGPRGAGWAVTAELPARLAP